MGKEITESDMQNRESYFKAKPKQFGTLHERMKYVMSFLSDERDAIGNDLWHAIFDLETEVSYHKPVNPPYGRRTIARPEKTKRMNQGKEIDRIIEVASRDCRRVSSGDIKTLCREIQRLRESLAFVRKYADETHNYWDAGNDAKVGKRLLAMAGHLHGYDHELDKTFG